MTALIARWLSAWFPVEDLLSVQLRRVCHERQQELYAQWNARLFPGFQSAAPTVGR